MDTDMEAKRGKEEITDLVLPRFLRYLAYWTTSDPQEEATPSSPGQWDLAKALVQELKDLGVAEVALTAYCYVIARLPPTPGKEAAETVGFLAHLDTAPDVSGKDVRPCVVEAYDGSPIALAGGLVLDPALDPDLASLRGQTLVHTDGTTLLGADDKAGIAVLMGVVAYLAAHPEVEHGPVEIIFTPDEETGKGLPEFPGKDLKARICYTLDGGALGEVESECFNAYRAEIQCTGAPVHLGYARGRLVNAALMAASFALMLPRSESPEATDGYYGYYGLTA
ncbi:MAG: tripeptide aminopeptidase PepT, partial [Spirochaetaceae bacterium]|nr:tripeptide aminopeptidase PepT [Spirochaetaceae bacterium]